MSSCKYKYNAAKIISKLFYHKKLKLLEITWKRNHKSHARNLNKHMYLYILNIYR